ncbi:hypothetical protein [Streptococcus gallinaceus]|uniref:DUF4190 domain-containing protein n=1 Tax=Streptococcus gallinaceus TaxID=165758 RepID=A0ABV2JJV7_9STRE|nr:hypothetical protein [Streptococcus gallinaceus]MCP1638519.1 hypothetical protein [Streptococcus gallinaceus]MCP1769394.1 hypothetical protein [Streptococcus gallinaceus]
METPKSKAPLVLGIVSIIFSLLIAIVGLICGIIGLVLSLNGKKATAHDYKLEIILNGIGIAIAVANMLYTYLVLMPAILGK